MRYIVATAVSVLPVATLAQDLAAADFDALGALSADLCVTPMITGELPDLSGLRSVQDVGDTVFSDAAVTNDDRVVVDWRLQRGLRDCAVATNTLTTQFRSQAGFEMAAEALDAVAAELVIAGFAELSGCEINGLRIEGPIVLEPGDYLRRFSFPDAGSREGLSVSVTLGAARYDGMMGVHVQELYGPLGAQC